MHKGFRQAIVDPPFGDANRGPDFQQSGSYRADLPGVGHLHRCGPDGLFEQYKQLIGQAADQQTQEVGPVAVVGQPLGKAHGFDLLDSVFTGLSAHAEPL